ncbi:uncharacterized protein TNCV_13181 [Trichonephila clavipes]|nr:uncharacterized protein TNCV_13181 [Trichonephila clavipes]
MPLKTTMNDNIRKEINIIKGRMEAQLTTFVASASEFFRKIWLEKNHLNEFPRGRMIGKLEEGRNFTSVAEEFGIHKSIVSRARKAFQTIGTAVRKVGVVATLGNQKQWMIDISFCSRKEPGKNQQAQCSATVQSNRETSVAV